MAEAPTARDDARRLLDGLHDILVVLLIVLRPLAWDGQPGQPADLIWQALAAGALLVCGLERVAGLAPGWRWGWRGVAGLVLVLALLPATLAAPESAAAWCQWTGWVACAAAAIYLAQVVPERVRLATAALLAVLALESVLAITQQLWVLPAMAAAQTADTAGFAGLGMDRGDLAERIANGGVFATFTLGNQLGAWLALLLPLSVAMLVAWRGTARIIGGVIMVLGLTALVFASAKGAWLALGLAGAVGWWIAFPGRWWRWLPLPGFVLAVAVLLSSHLADASIHVRTGYWQAAVALVREAPWSGHGVGGFAGNYPRLMQPGDEPTIFVHNEVLEAAVSGGVWLGILLAAVLVLIAWPRREASADAESPQRTVHPAVPWVLAFFVPYIALLGALDGNLGWWPGVTGAAGGDALGSKLFYALLLGAGTAWLCSRLREASPLPAWAWSAGLATAVVGPVIDFDLHAGGYLGTLLLVGCIAPGRRRRLGGTVVRIAGLALGVAAVALVMSAALTGRRLADAEDTLALLDAARRDEGAARELGARFPADPAQPPGEQIQRVLDHAWDAAEGSARIRLNVLQLTPAGAGGSARAEALAAQAPHSQGVALHHANRLLGERRWNEAAAEAERAARLAPTSPRVLAEAAAILEQAAGHAPEGGHAARAAALRAEAMRLQPLVDAKLRLNPASTAPR